MLAKLHPAEPCVEIHPDDAGHSDLTLHAAFDPARFPVVSVTAEDGGDGPGPGREVARLSR